MEETHRKKSLFLSFLMLTSVMVGLVGLMPTAVAANETTSGTITGTEVWSGSHTLTGSVIVGTGANLIVQPGTTVTMPNGTIIDVRGGLCAGDVACGASGMATSILRELHSIGKIRRMHLQPDIVLDCSITSTTIETFPCNEGILLRSTV